MSFSNRLAKRYSEPHQHFDGCCIDLQSNKLSYGSSAHKLSNLKWLLQLLSNSFAGDASFLVYFFVFSFFFSFIFFFYFLQSSVHLLLLWSLLVFVWFWRQPLSRTYTSPMVSAKKNEIICTVVVGARDVR